MLFSKTLRRKFRTGINFELSGAENQHKILTFSQPMVEPSAGILIGCRLKGLRFVSLLRVGSSIHLSCTQCVVGGFVRRINEKIQDELQKKLVWGVENWPVQKILKCPVLSF